MLKPILRIPISEVMVVRAQLSVFVKEALEVVKSVFLTRFSQQKRGKDKFTGTESDGAGEGAEEDVSTPRKVTMTVA